MKERLYLRPGVTLKHLTRETRRGFETVAFIFFKYQEPFCVTCTRHGAHRPGSLHPADQAFDSEKPDKSRKVIFDECKKALGDAWDVVNELNHWHFEYDPDH